MANRERYRNAGAHNAREPVTNATAVNPSDDNTKLRLANRGTERNKEVMSACTIAFWIPRTKQEQI